MAKRPARPKGRPRQEAAGPRGASAPTTPSRLDIVDAARGLAIVMMIAYHFCFDLTWFGWAHWPMLTDPAWIAWRASIVTSLLFLVGVSLALRNDRERRTGGSSWLAASFAHRWLQVAGAAVLVTIGSVALFPERYIYFGVLHFVAVALWVCRRAPRRPAIAIVAAAVVIAARLSFSNATFDTQALNWIGFVTGKPPTEDYVPLFPWLGAVLAGCGLGAIWIRRDRRLWWPVAGAWNALPPPIRRVLSTLGRWSLTTYLVHQPLMLGAMAAVRRFA